MAITLCDFDIKKNIKYDCDKPLIRQYEPYAIIANRRNVSWSSNGDGTFKISCLDFYVIRNKNDKPFEGTISEFENENPYGGRFKKTVAFDIPEFGAEIGKEAVEPIFAGEEFLMIFEKKDKSEKTRYEIFGLENGLKIESGSRDMVADGVWKVVLTETGATIAEVGFWDTNENTTVAQFERYLNYEWIRGLNVIQGDEAEDLSFEGFLYENGTFVETPLQAHIYPKTEDIIILRKNKTALIAVNSYLRGVLKTSADIINVSGNYLTSLSVPNATEIDCRYNQITSLSAPNATQISCSSNALTSLSAPNATYIDCSDNQITSLSVPNATVIVCIYNSMTSLSAPNATEIDCSDNQITSLSAPNATVIVCSQNQLSPVSIESLLSELKSAGKLNGTLQLQGGGNAPRSTWSQQAKDDALTLSNRGWSITYNN